MLEIEIIFNLKPMDLNSQIFCIHSFPGESHEYSFSVSSFFLMGQVYLESMLGKLLIRGPYYTRLS